MAAVKVYGMAIGDTLRHPEQGFIKIEMFKWTGPSANPWIAVVSCENGQPDFDIPAKELKDMEK